jgi:hypothetical protein
MSAGTKPAAASEAAASEAAQAEAAASTAAPRDASGAAAVEPRAGSGETPKPLSKQAERDADKLATFVFMGAYPTEEALAARLGWDLKKLARVRTNAEAHGWFTAEAWAASFEKAKAKAAEPKAPLEALRRLAEELEAMPASLCPDDDPDSDDGPTGPFVSPFTPEPGFRDAPWFKGSRRR